LAAALKVRHRFAGKTVVAILSGGNLDLSRLSEILATA
jgi:threonine dehydratase